MMVLRRRSSAAPPVATPHTPDAAARLEGAARLAATPAVRARIAAAPAGYALAHTASDVARHAELVEPLPSREQVRAVCTPDATPATWKLDLVARDRPGLLAMFTGVLVHEAMQIDQAILATWDDGAALQALTVRAEHAPDAEALERALTWSLGQSLWAPPVDGATVRFDQSRSSVYTACEVSAPDRPGLLHAIAVALADAGADIHAASVATVDGVAVDRFDLTDRSHRKLADGVAARIAANLRAGFSGRV